MVEKKKEKLDLSLIANDSEVRSYIEYADKFLEAIGYTEHGFRHAHLVAERAELILRRLSFNHRLGELAAIAGFLHDIGNVISREVHGVSSALLARSFLKKFGFPPDEIAIVMNAIANHEEEYGMPTHPVGAALVIADKSDVHYSRVRASGNMEEDIHDRVNLAARDSKLEINPKERKIILRVEIDTEISRVMEYFEIFLTRMIMSRKAAEFLRTKFHLVINGVELL